MKFRYLRASLVLWVVKVDPLRDAVVVASKVVHVVELGTQHQVPVHGKLVEVVRCGNHVVDLDPAVEAFLLLLLLLVDSVLCNFFAGIPQVKRAVHGEKDIHEPPDACAVELGHLCCLGASLPVSIMCLCMAGEFTRMAVLLLLLP